MYYVDIIVSIDTTLKACCLASFQIQHGFVEWKLFSFRVVNFSASVQFSTIHPSVFILRVSADVSELFSVSLCVCLFIFKDGWLNVEDVGWRETPQSRLVLSNTVVDPISSLTGPHQNRPHRQRDTFIESCSCLYSIFLTHEQIVYFKGTTGPENYYYYYYQKVYK